MNMLERRRAMKSSSLGVIFIVLIGLAVGLLAVYLALLPDGAGKTTVTPRNSPPSKDARVMAAVHRYLDSHLADPNYEIVNTELETFPPEVSDWPVLWVTYRYTTPAGGPGIDKLPFLVAPDGTIKYCPSYDSLR